MELPLYAHMNSRNQKASTSLYTVETEQELIKRAQKGDGEAFGGLYDHYSQAIFRFIAIRVTEREEAEDILHEVFLSAWQKLPNYVAKGFPFSSWLYRIARNRVIDYYRTKKAHVRIDDPLSDLRDQLPDEQQPRADVELDITLSLEKAQAAISQLSSDQQEIIILRFVEDLSPKEVALILGKKEGAIRTIQFRAIQALKKILNA